VLEKTLFHFHSVHDKSHMNYPDIEAGPPW